MAGPAFFARYDGECDECGASFEAGDSIRYDDDQQLLREDCCGHVYAGGDY